MKTWTDKLDAGTPVVKPTPRTMGDVVEGQVMLVPTALAGLLLGFLLLWLGAEPKPLIGIVTRR